MLTLEEFENKLRSKTSLFLIVPKKTYSSEDLEKRLRKAISELQRGEKKCE